MTSRLLRYALALASLVGVSLPIARVLASSGTEAPATRVVAPGDTRLAQDEPTPGGLPGMKREPEPGGLPGMRPDMPSAPAARPDAEPHIRSRSAKPKKKPDPPNGETTKKGDQPK